MVNDLFFRSLLYEHRRLDYFRLARYPEIDCDRSGRRLVDMLCRTLAASASALEVVARESCGRRPCSLVRVVIERRGLPP
jgi:hypothetical protein